MKYQPIFHKLMHVEDINHFIIILNLQFSFNYFTEICQNSLHLVTLFNMSSFMCLQLTKEDKFLITF